ncbi:trypsin-like, partial [Penaeus monodon]|uniref:trypsin-like n=1 Tax=Penaeus monodon TaxID=6687 RepID=UPI0018A6EEC7
AVVIIVVEDENYDPSDITLASLLYDEDAPWGPCTRSCAARRHRKCVYPELCGEEEILEKAMCYVPGSNCETEVREFLEEEGYIIVENNEDEILEDDLEADPDFDIGDYIDVDVVVVEDDYGSDGAEYGSDGAEYYDYGWYDYINSLTGGGVDAGCGRKMVGGRESLLRIIGGREASRGSWPWQVAVLNRFKEVFCGGTLISSQWVLTAAHCVRKRLYVRLAEHDIRAYDHQEVEMRVESYFTHPNYDEETIDSDIALLKLPRHASFSRYILPACLPGRGTPPPAKSKVPIVTKSACRKAYPDHPLTDNHFCAGNKRGTSDTCAGDSGGPLMCEGEQGRWTVHGVTSFGEGCGDHGKYGVYTKVANYLGWIKKIIKEN